MEIYVNSNTAVKHKIFWQGAPYDSDANSLPVVYVYDVTEDPTLVHPVNPSTLLTTLTAEKVETDFGVYQVYIPYNLTVRQRKLKLVWTYTVDNVSNSKPHFLFVVTPYTDITQVIDELGIGADPSDPNYRSFAELQQAERYARKVIEVHTGQQFYLYHDTHVIYGDDSDSLRLPYRIEELHQLYQGDVVLVDTINDINNLPVAIQISNSNFGIRANRADAIDNIVYVANGMVPPSINDIGRGIFKSGIWYTVNGKFGWPEVPDEIELATIELIKDYFSKDKTWRNKYVNNVKSHDWQFEYNPDSYKGTGNLYVDQLLSNYVITQMVVI
jgi:hypothetical protein